MSNVDRKRDSADEVRDIAVVGYLKLPRQPSQGRSPPENGDFRISGVTGAGSSENKEESAAVAARSVMGDAMRSLLHAGDVGVPPLAR